jgi:hypothetical protein
MSFSIWKLQGAEESRYKSMISFLYKAHFPTYVIPKMINKLANKLSISSPYNGQLNKLLGPKYVFWRHEWKSTVNYFYIHMKTKLQRAEGQVQKIIYFLRGFTVPPM